MAVVVVAVVVVVVAAVVAMAAAVVAATVEPAAPVAMLPGARATLAVPVPVPELRRQPTMAAA
ncbi:MAG TPA: hypothetical protein VFE41_03840 [Acetobacteraceae bacterium]|nr:hypothetical protein [Acetobacteraceae bacterium]